MFPSNMEDFISILELRRLNRFLKKFPLSMLQVTDFLRSLAERDWFTSVDLTDAYFHVSWQKFGMEKVDLFASENTTLCPLWFAQMEASSQLWKDALSQIVQCMLFLCLRFFCCGRHFTGLLRAGTGFFCLSKPQFPLVLTLLVGRPKQLPFKRDLLS